MIPKAVLKRAIESGRADLVAAAQKYLTLATSPYYSFRPRPDRPDDLDEQASFVNDQFPGLACVIGGNGGGKSYAGAYKVAKFIRETPAPRPNTPYWIVSQTREMSAGNNWSKNLSQFITEDLIQDVVWYSQARKLPKAVVLKPDAKGNNWTLEFHSYDMDRKALQAFSLGGFWCDELCPYPILMELWMRCRDYDFPGSKLYTLTPLVDGSKGYTTHELEEIYKDRTNHPDWKFYRLNSRLNDKLAAGFIDRFIANEIEDLRETRLTGAFCSLSGAVYKGFNDTHIVQPFPIPDDWYHLRGIDFGWSHETVCLWIARDPSARYFVYAEYAQQKALLRDHLASINAIPWGKDKQYWGETWADPAAAQERRELAADGLVTWTSKKDVLPGIACVARLLRSRQLFFFDTCKTAIRQMRSYCWSKTVKDKVEKQDDDAVDALRYAVFNDQRGWRPEEEPTEDKDTRIRKREAELMGS